MLRVGHLDAHQPVGQVGVGVEPLLRAPGLVCQHHLDEQQVGQRVAHRLVDEVAERAQVLERCGLRRRLRLVRSHGAQRRGREDHGAVAIGLKVDANVEARGRVMQVLDARGRADDGQAQGFGDVGRAGAVRVGRLHHADLQLISQPSKPRNFADKGRHERGDLVAVEQVEGAVGVGVVVHDAVGVAVERGAAGQGRSLRRGRWALLRLDKVGSTLQVLVGHIERPERCSRT